MRQKCFKNIQVIYQIKATNIPKKLIEMETSLIGSILSAEHFLKTVRLS